MAETKEDYVKEEKLLNERKEKLVKLIKVKYEWIFYIILAIIVWLSVKIRTSNLAGLRDTVTGAWTLGPDLDPFLFLRYAKHIVENGSLMAIDMFRYSPIGFNPRDDLILHPYLMAWFHKIAGIFGSTSIEQSSVVFPAFMFALTIIAFFFFVRKAFTKSQGNIRASSIALISSLFLTVIPVLIPRTIAGIPEKESAAFLFLFLAFYLFITAWQSKNIKSQLTFGILSGLATAAMALIWGGFIFIFLSISLTTIISFLMSHMNKEKFYVYASWLLSASVIMILFSNRFSVGNLISSTSTAPAYIVLFALIVDMIIYNTKIKRYFNNPKIEKIPRPVISLIVTLILGVLILAVAPNYGPSFIFNKFDGFVNTLVRPVSDRLGVTVAENRQPFFTEWEGSFGPHWKGIALFFWLFFIGSIYLFYNMVKSFKSKDRLIMTLGYAIFIFTLIFSRYSQNSILNGTSPTSLIFYFGGVIILLATLSFKGVKSLGKENHYYAFAIASLVLLSIWLKTDSFTFMTLAIISFIPFLFLTLIGISKEELFEKIDFSIIFIFAFFFLTIVSARSAVRLIMMIVPSASIIVAYFVVSSFNKALKHKGEIMKVLSWVIVVLVIISTFFSAYQFYLQATATSQSYVPSTYNQQWQRAMAWVRDNTSQEAVFGHWWDYGYWVQTIGERATVLDGGNVLPYWNHLMGRYPLTAPSGEQITALEYLYAHKATHFLIDSTDIGKYSAFSSIGSDEDYDRASFIQTMSKDSTRTQERKDSTVEIYTGGIPLDEDIIFEDNGTKIILPGGSAFLGGVLIEKDEGGNILSNPIGIFVYRDQQYQIPLRYTYYNRLIDFKSGIDAGVFLMPKVTQTEGGNVNIDQTGSLLYLSRRTVDSQLARLYLYKENNLYFNLVHSEDDYIVSILKQQNAFPPGIDIIDFNGFRGPIRIWEINYPEEIKNNDPKPEFLELNYPSVGLTVAR